MREIAYVFKLAKSDHRLYGFKFHMQKMLPVHSIVMEDRLLRYKENSLQHLKTMCVDVLVCFATSSRDNFAKDSKK